MTRRRRPGRPDWYHDFLVECWDSLPGCLPTATVDPDEAVATRPSRGRPNSSIERRRSRGR
jgi:hypothetical protein